MVHVTDKEFENIISEALDSLPEEYTNKLQNVAIVWENQPNNEQRKKLKLGTTQTLFGLYEGVPRPRRGGSTNLILPDKITIFKLPIETSVNTVEQLKEQVRHTLWHEIAHHFGLDHQQIDRLE